MKKLIKQAVERMNILRYFPSDPGAQLEIMRLLERMVPSERALEWLVSTMIDRVGEWQGPVELRGVLCAKFRPKDGIEAWSTIPGFTAADSEAQTAWIEKPDVLSLPTGERRLLAAPEDEAALERVFPEIDHQDLRQRVLKRMPRPTAKDREYSRKLLGHLVQ